MTSTIICLCILVASSFIDDDATNLVNNDDFWSSVNDDNIKDLLYEELEDISSINRAKADVNFRLFTRSNPTEFQLLSTNNVDKLQLSNFNPNTSTIFITHGWKGEPYSPSCTLIRDGKDFFRSNKKHFSCIS